MTGDSDRRGMDGAGTGDGYRQTDRGLVSDSTPARRGVFPDGSGDGVPSGERFVEYHVNGEQQRTQRSSLRVEEILRLAGSAAGINTTDLGSYYLERLGDDRKFEKLEDTVTIGDGDQYLAVYSGRTPVA